MIFHKDSRFRQKVFSKGKDIDRKVTPYVAPMIKTSVPQVAFLVDPALTFINGTNGTNETSNNLFVPTSAPEDDESIDNDNEYIKFKKSI